MFGGRFIVRVKVEVAPVAILEPHIFIGRKINLVLVLVGKRESKREISQSISQFSPFSPLVWLRQSLETHFFIDFYIAFIMPQ